MRAVTFLIEGFSPSSEVVEAATHYGCYSGQAIIAKGVDGHLWRYIFTGSGLRKPVDLELYLFN